MTLQELEEEYQSGALEGEVVEEEDTTEDDLSEAMELIEQFTEAVEGVLKACVTKRLTAKRYKELEDLCVDATGFMNIWEGKE